MGKSPTVTPATDFDAEEDAKALKTAFKGFGSDEQAIIDIITKRSNTQRLEIASKFKTMYGKDLIKELKSELRGNFEDIIIALMTPPFEYQAKELHKAISGLGTDEDTLIEILGVHNNEEIQSIRDIYEGLYQTSLEKDLKGDTSGTLKRLFVSLANGNRDETDKTDKQVAYKDAQSLLRAGELVQGTDESTFNQILCQRNRPQLKLIFDEYQKLVGHDFEQAIRNEFSGAIKDSLLALVHCVKDKLDYLATRLQQSMEGIGTDDRTLIRIVVSRSENDLGEVKRIFEGKYGKSLADAIESETSGDYKKCILAVVG